MASFADFTLEGIAALIAVLLTLLGILCGGAWWASAMYTKVGQLVNELKDLNTRLVTLAQSQDRDTKEIWGEIGRHGERITKIETKIETIIES